MNKILMNLLVVFLFCFNSACFAQNNDALPHVYHLKTGQTVVIKEIHSNPIVTVDTWVKTGSLNENDKNNGVSHFLEHLMFKGTDKYKQGELDKILESKGGKFNAATSKDFTHFYITIPSKDIETAVKLHADMMTNAAIPEKELAQERKVVIEEIRRSEDNPDSILFDNLINLIFKKHPYRYKTLGPQKNIANIPRKDILDYYHKYYVPSNMTTVVVGDVNAAQILCMLEENFKAKSTTKLVLPKFNRESEMLKPLTEIKGGKYNFGYAIMAFKGIPVKEKKETCALDLASSILGGGKSSRLYQDLKEKQNIVSSIDTGHYSLRDDSIFYISADFEPANYQKVKSAVVKQLKQLADTKVSVEELKRAKTQEERAYIYNNESIESISQSLGYCMTIEGNIDSYINHLKYVNSVSADDIQNAVKKYIKLSGMATSVLLPADIKSKLKASDNDDEVKNIQAEMATNIINKQDSVINKNSILNISNKSSSKTTCQQSSSTLTKSQKNAAYTVKSVLNNGMTLITNKNTSNDIISLSVFIKGGKFIDNPAGISNLLIETLMQGTKTKSALEITNSIEDMGIVISPELDSDAFEIKLKTTSNDFDKAFDILADIIKNPAFTEEYVQKGKNDIIQDIVKSRDRPLSKASEGFARAMYSDSSYGNIGEILEKSVPSLTREQLADFHKKIFIPQNMIVSISGNVDHDSMLRKFEDNFPCTGGEKLSVKYSNQLKQFSDNIIILKKDETAAAWMLIGWPVDGIRCTKDYLALQVIDSILGGGMSSRLHITFREKQGLSYAVGSSYGIKMDKSYLAMYIGTEPKNIELVKSKFLQEMTRLKTEKVSNEELNDAKQKIIGDFLIGQETNQSKAHILGWFENVDKGFNFAYDFPELINSVNSDDIINTANKYFASPYVLSIVAPEKDMRSLKK